MSHSEMIFQTDNEAGFCAKFSPNDSTVLAATSGSNFGIRGSGSLWLLKVANGKIDPISRRIWPDVVTHLDWNPIDPSILSVASGDGSVSVWKIAESGSLDLVKTGREHLADGSCVVWPGWGLGSSFILSSSWDGTVKMWDSTDLSKSLSTFRLGRDIRANDISVSDKSSGQFTVSTSSGCVHIFDVRQASTSSSTSSSTPTLTLTHGGDVLTHDVSKFNANVVVSGGVSRSILCWDLRNCRRPFVALNGHSHPVKCLVASFHRPEQFCSTSFDFSVRLWNQSTCLDVLQHHTEFVTSLDLDRHNPGFFVDSSWDGTIKISSFSPKTRS